MASESAEPIERWTAKRRVALVVSILKGETSVAEAARTHGLTVAEVEDWREKFIVGAENALRSRPRDEDVSSPVKDTVRKENFRRVDVGRLLRQLLTRARTSSAVCQLVFEDDLAL